MIRVCLGFACLVGAMAFLPACVDTTDNTASVDAAAGDAMSEGGPLVTPALIESCRTCVTEGPCKSQYDNCVSDPRCAALVQCLMGSYCLNYSIANLADLPPCVTNCGADSGVQGLSDPSLARYIPIYACVHNGMTGCVSTCDVGGADEDGGSIVVPPSDQ